MKKPYVKPQSSLMMLNFSENIAASSPLGQDSISAGAVILFTHAPDTICRGYYTGIQTAPVAASGDFYAYWHELYYDYGADVYYKCYLYIPPTMP